MLSNGAQEDGAQDQVPRVSIVDDDASVSRALGRLLRLAGYDVQAFDSAERFLDEEGPEASDCLVLDVHLPGLSGPELQARLAEEGRRLPIVFITAFDGPRVKEQALEAGALAFLRKPLDNDELLGVLRGALGEG